MEVSQDSPLQEAAENAEGQEGASQDLAGTQGPFDAEVDLAGQAFVVGYAIHGDVPVTHRARVAHTAAKALAIEYHHPMVLRFVEAVGATEGLYAKIYKRRDRLWMKYDILIKRWSKTLSLNVPADLLASELDKAYREAPADTKKQRDAVKAAALTYLSGIVAQHPALDEQVRALAAAADAEGTAEGQAAAAALSANLRKQQVKDFPTEVAKYLAALQASRDYGKNTRSIKTAILSGLAGDVAISYVANANEGADSDQLKAAALKAVGAGAGASFYLDLNIHSAFALAMLSVYATADPGLKVDFTTVGDEKVCPQCLAAEDGNPYSPSNVPDIPLHAGCRCWYTPSDDGE